MPRRRAATYRAAWRRRLGATQPGSGREGIFHPRHYVTARAVESACWTAASEWDYPEHFKAGLKPHGPSEKYYFARGPQLVNRVVDIGPYIDQKVLGNMANVTQGRAGSQRARLRRTLAE